MGRNFFALVIAVLMVWSSSACLGYTGGSGTPEDPYQIATKDDLLELAGAAGDYNKSFILTADIDMGGQIFTEAIIGETGFAGTFDGNRHKITNYNIYGAEEFLGLFKQINSSGIVRNLGLENFYSGGSSYSYSGGLVGRNYGSIIACYSTGDVYGSQYVGGLVGRNYGSIVACYSTGSVNSSVFYIGGLVGRNEMNSSISNCYSTCAVSGSISVGGLVGHNYNSDISYCYSTGSVSGSLDVGGLIGYNSSSIATSCFWDTETSGQTTSAGGEGKTTTEMQTPVIFINGGWDFVDENDNGREDFWRLCNEGTEYPRLNWQNPTGDFGCPDGVEVNDLAILYEQWLLEEIPADVWPNKGDGIVNFLDWAVFASQWERAAGYEAVADFTGQWLQTGVYYCLTDIAPGSGDGIVNLSDFAAFASNWLEGL